MSVNTKPTLEELQKNREEAPELSADQIGVKLNYNWDSTGSNGSKSQQDPSGRYNGIFYGYCAVCDELHPIEEMCGDIWVRPYGLRRKCKKAANAGLLINNTRAKSNGVPHLNNTFIKPSSSLLTIAPDADVIAERIFYLNKLEEIWIKAEENKHITFDNLIQMGFADKMKFIYITRWFGICDELKQKMDEEIEPNIEAYYVGQTNGKDPLYNGSGTNVDKLKELIIDYPDVKAEIRIIEIVDLDKVDQKEYIKIKETGAIKYGLNIASGVQKANLIPIKFQLDPSNDKELDAYHDLLFRSKESGKSLEAIAKSTCINGNTCRHLFQQTMDDAADNGDILPHTYWYKKIMQDT